MYAIIELGGRQWKVEPGTTLEINRIQDEVGSTHTVERVLLVQNGQQLQVGRPYLQGAKVACEVLAHQLGPKEISYHFRRRENWRKTVGHRKPLTRLRVTDILIDGASHSDVAEAVDKPRAAKTATKTPTVKKLPRTLKKESSP